MSEGKHVDIAADLVADQGPAPTPEALQQYNDFLGLTEMLQPPCQSKRAPRWTATPKGHLMYDDRPVADLRYSAARGRVQFILNALNAAEEKL
jgi:hypothetical protein